MRQLTATMTAGLFAMLLIAGSVDAAKQPDRLPKITSKSAEAVAKQVDTLIDGHLRETGVEPLPPASDEDFLRRVSLDLAGRIPAPRDVTLFGLNPDKNKRSAAIDGLLETEDYARTWASYWREVIFSRATEVRSRIGQPVFEDWMTEQLQTEQTWDEITTALLTATGNTQEDGSTALMFAHGGDPAEIAGEVSRIFLGIQIQCANCHNHPYDQWKREDFHELAAFFPRVRLRRDGKVKPPTYTIDSVDNERPLNRKGLDADYLIKLLDSNRDGKVTKEESKKAKQFAKRFDQVLAKADKNGDGALSRQEMKELPLPPVKVGAVRLNTTCRTWRTRRSLARELSRCSS